MPTNRKTPTIAAGLFFCTIAAAVQAQNPLKPLMERVPGPRDHVRRATLGEAGVGIGSLTLGKPLPKTLPPVSEEGSVHVWQSFTEDHRQRSLSKSMGKGQTEYRNALDIVTRTNVKRTFVVEAIRIAGFSVPGGFQKPSYSGYMVADRRPTDTKTGLSWPRHNVRIGDSEQDVLRAFPAAKRAAHYFCRERKATIDVYDDKAQGIAFEIQPWQGAGIRMENRSACRPAGLTKRLCFPAPTAIEKQTITGKR